MGRSSTLASMIGFGVAGAVREPPLHVGGLLDIGLGEGSHSVQSNTPSILRTIMMAKIT